MKGTLYLIPSPLGEGSLSDILPIGVIERVSTISYFIAEHPKTARQFLKLAGSDKPIQEIGIAVLDEHTKRDDLDVLLEPILEGRDAGLVSEAGCPAVADPGSDLVMLAHEKGIRVIPLVGPSSILLALMASGLGGQRFSFHGYLPVEKEKLSSKIREMEKESGIRKETQIFIETPYRNRKLLEALLEHCNDATLLCVATDVTLPSESVITKKIAEWKKNPFEIGKRPTVFLIRC